MPQSKTRKNAKPAAVISQDKPESNPLLEIIKGISAKKNKKGTQVTLSYKNKVAKLPTIGSLDYLVYLECFEALDNGSQTLGEAIPQVAKYFVENNDEFKELVRGCSVQEAVALTMAWFSNQGNPEQLGK